MSTGHPETGRPRDDDSHRASDERKTLQADHTRAAVNAGRGNRKKVVTHRTDAGGSELLLVEDVLTTRSADLAAVQVALQDGNDAALASLVGGSTWTAVDGSPIEGVATVTFAGAVDVTAICRVFDSRIRLGAVMPMGVVHITPTGFVHSEPCPSERLAVWPTRVDATRDLGDGVDVVVIDTGRLPAVEGEHPWLTLPPITGDDEPPRSGTTVVTAPSCAGSSGPWRPRCRST